MEREDSMFRALKDVAGQSQRTSRKEYITGEL